jgi:hypothetical protein
LWNFLFSAPLGQKALFDPIYKFNTAENKSAVYILGRNLKIGDVNFFNIFAIILGGTPAALAE